MKSASLNAILSPFRKIGKFFSVHGQMIYFVLFVSVLIGAVLGLNLALSQPTDEAYRATKMGDTQSARFDTDTIEKIKVLNSGQQTMTDSVAPGARTNPFGE